MHNTTKQPFCTTERRNPKLYKKLTMVYFLRKRMKTIPSRRITSKAEQQESTKEPATRNGIVPVKSLLCVFERQKRRFLPNCLTSFAYIYIIIYINLRMGRSTNTLSRYMQMKGVPLPIQLAVRNLTK